MNRLPVFATILDAIRFVWANRRDFFAFAYLPVIANALLGVALRSSLPHPTPTTPEAWEAALTPLSVMLMVLALAASLGFYVVFAVAWHRRHLLPGEVSTVGAALRWRPRHWRFFLGTVILGLVGFLATMLAVNLAIGALGAIMPLTAAAALMVATLAALMVATALVRLLPLFAAIAIDDRTMTVGAAWRLTRGNGFGLFLVLFGVGILGSAATLLAGIPIAMTIGNPMASGSLIGILIVELVQQIIIFVSIALTTTVVSIAYSDLSAQAGGGGTSV